VHSAGAAGDLRALDAWAGAGRAGAGRLRARPARVAARPAGTGPGGIGRLAQPVEPRAVVPEDLLLGRLAHALEAEERLDRAGIGRVVVRPIGGVDDLFVAHLAGP